MTATAEPAQSFSTDLPAAALEFCPLEPYTDLFFTGTYQLHDSQSQSNDGEEQTRSGKCLVYQRDSGTASAFRRTQELDFAGILDLKWNHATPLLGVADSIGQISILRLSGDESSPRLSHLQTIQCGDTSSTLCLSLDWSNRRHQHTGPGSIATSLSDGNISILRPSEGSWDVERTWKAHDYEPWVVAWDYWNESVVYSGGDDLTFRGWDLRAEDEPTGLFKDKKSFSGGVTSIQSSPHDEHILAVGSYDESLLIFDTRNVSRPIVRARVNVGGGVWRVKWHPSPQRKGDLLVAAMHDGAKVVRMHGLGGSSDEAWEPEITKKFEKHESMAYGADWSYAHEEGEETCVATCSFYDKALHVWSG